MKKGLKHFKEKGHLSCTPPRIDPLEITRLQNRHKIKVAISKQQWKRKEADPNISGSLFMPTSVWASGTWELNAQGVEVFLDGFPDGTLFSQIDNSAWANRAFSRMFGPNLFAELGMPNPFPGLELYWQNFFSRLPGGLRLGITNLGDSICFGVVGQYQSSGMMSIYNCTDESDIFHEIGHGIMDDGIMKGMPPLFAPVFDGKVPLGDDIELNVKDTAEWLTKYFGKPKKDPRKDPLDHVEFGFVTDYAMDNQSEDFAETFKHYVYNPDKLFGKIEQQRAQGSNVLAIKAGLISTLYAGMWFSDYGVPGGWGGFPI